MNPIFRSALVTIILLSHSAVQARALDAKSISPIKYWSVLGLRAVNPSIEALFKITDKFKDYHHSTILFDNAFVELTVEKRIGDCNLELCPLSESVSIRLPVIKKSELGCYDLLIAQSNNSTSVQIKETIFVERFARERCPNHAEFRQGKVQYTVEARKNTSGSEQSASIRFDLVDVKTLLPSPPVPLNN